jgi:hypothetical protein
MNREKKRAYSRPNAQFAIYTCLGTTSLTDHFACLTAQHFQANIYVHALAGVRTHTRTQKHTYVHIQISAYDISSSLAKQPFLSHSLPQKILPVLSIRKLDHLVCTSSHFATTFFCRARSSASCPPPNLEDQVSVFMSPSDRVAQLYPQVPGSLFVSFYVSQGYGGGILTRLHTGSILYLVIQYMLYIYYPVYIFICKTT